MSSSSQKIEYSNCRTLPIDAYGYRGFNYKGTMWTHRGEHEMLFGQFVASTNRSLGIKLKVTFKDGTFIYVTKK